MIFVLFPNPLFNTDLVTAIIGLSYAVNTIEYKNTLIPKNLGDKKFERASRPNFLQTKLIAWIFSVC